MTSVLLLGAAARRCCRGRSLFLLPSSSSVRSSSLGAAPRSLIYFSTTSHEMNKNGTDDTVINKRQPFVEVEIEPGEWDERKTDPLHRPKYKSRARIISKEDFAHQNRVSFEEQYDNFADAMITLSWMDHPTQARIYDLYLALMKTAHEKHGKTSHEYVCRLLAQKFSITPFRAAAIVQLQHNEEQYKLNEPERQLLTKEAAIMDAMMKHTYAAAYASTGETPPESFVEQVDSAGGKPHHSTMTVDDVMDVDQLTRDVNIREQERARMMINDHIYIEDVDDETLDIPMTKDALNFIQQQQKLKEVTATTTPTPLPSPAAERAVAAKGGERRPRWKFVAQTINTRDLNPKSPFSHYQHGKLLRGRRHRNRFHQDWPENTLVEHDGELRPANLAEVKQTSWKPVRHVQEFTFAAVKQGWLDRTVRNKANAWGKKPIYEGVPTAAAGGGGDQDTVAKSESKDDDEVEVVEVSSDDSSSDDDGESDSDSSSDDDDEKGDDDDTEQDDDDDDDDKDED